MEWINAKHKTPPVNKVVIAYDGIGKSIGYFDGNTFDSLTDGYSWDNEYSDNICIGKTVVDKKVIGKITFWMHLPEPPTI